MEIPLALSCHRSVDHISLLLLLLLLPELGPPCLRSASGWVRTLATLRRRWGRCWTSGEWFGRRNSFPVKPWRHTFRYSLRHAFTVGRNIPASNGPSLWRNISACCPGRRKLFLGSGCCSLSWGNCRAGRGLRLLCSLTLSPGRAGTPDEVKPGSSALRRFSAFHANGNSTSFASLEFGLGFLFSLLLNRGFLIEYSNKGIY